MNIFICRQEVYSFIVISYPIYLSYIFYPFITLQFYVNIIRIFNHAYIASQCLLFLILSKSKLILLIIFVKVGIFFQNIRTKFIIYMSIINLIDLFISNIDLLIN